MHDSGYYGYCICLMHCIWNGDVRTCARRDNPSVFFGHSANLMETELYNETNTCFASMLNEYKNKF